MFQAMGLVGFSQVFPKLQVPVEYIKEAPNAAPVAVSDASSAKATISPAPAGKFVARCPMDFSKNAPDSEISGMQRVTR